MRSVLLLVWFAHGLTGTATHPSGWVANPAASFFQVGVRAETVTDGYDEMGNVTSRVWSGGKSQTLAWDGKGRLIQVVQTGVEPFIWTATYDGLSRCIATSYQKVVAGVADPGSLVTTQSVFDPDVEFLEIGLAVNGAWNWKIYGPDLSGSYGGLQGLGGLEAVIGNDGVTRGVISDWFGNSTAFVAAPGAVITWSGAQFLAWGPVPGWGTPPLDGTKPLYQLLGYRGVTLDPTGYVHQGLRDYDAIVGRWLSPDTMGHAASLSLYDYCDNDPLNNFDPDGRFGKNVASYQYNGGLLGPTFYSSANYFQGIADDPGSGSWLVGGATFSAKAYNTFGNMVTPRSYVDGFQSTQGRVSSITQNSISAGQNPYWAAASAPGVALFEMTGVNNYVQGGSGYDLASSQSLDGWQRAENFSAGTVKLASSMSLVAGGPTAITGKVGSLPIGEAPYQLKLFPDEAYSRTAQYGRTPTQAQRASVPQGMEFDHNPTLVQHYYEGVDGGLAGFNLTQTERVQWAQSLNAGVAATPAAQRAQGATAAAYSKLQKKLWGLR